MKFLLYWSHDAHKILQYSNFDHKYRNLTQNQAVLVKDDAADGADAGTISEFGQTPIPSRPGTK